MGCTWLPNLSTYAFAVIQPWRVIMKPTECCTTILLPKPSQNLPRVLLGEQAFQIVGILGCSPNVNSSWCREQREGQLIWPHHARVSNCLMSCFIVMIGHHHFCMWALLSVIRGLAALPWMLVLRSSRRTVFVETVFTMNIQFCCHLCCSISVIFRNNPFQCTTIPFCQCWFSRMFLFVNVVLPWFMYADITLETVALYAVNNVAFFCHTCSSKRVLTICTLSKSNKSPIFGFFQIDCHSAQSLMHWHEHYRV
jgi:hypothetical protein